MTFSQSILKDLEETTVVQAAEEFEFHDLGQGVFELAVGGERMLLTRDAGIDLAFRLADFLASLEAKEAEGRSA